MALLNNIAEKASQAVGAKVRRRAGAEVAHKASQTIGRDVLVQGAKKATTTTVKKTATTTAKKSVDAAENAAFDAAMKAVRDRLSKEGKFANVSGPLIEAIAKVQTTEEGLQVASLARKLSVSFNPANRGALLQALETSAGKAKVHEEAYKTLAQVVRTREEAFAIFTLDEKRKIVETAVERYMTVGGLETEELVGKAIKLVKARFDQHSARSTIKRVSLMDKLADQVRTIANFLNKALS